MIIKTLIIVVLIGISFSLKAQNADAGANAIASGIAKKMQDSLNLSLGQKKSIGNINVQIHESKMAVWKEFSDTASIRVRVQRIENNRDSLYKAVLTAQQYEMYRQKKRTLISAN